jgi:hypothetical protein
MDEKQMTTDAPQRLDYEVTLDDVVRFNAYHHDHSPSSRRVFRSVQLTGTGLILGVAGVCAVFEAWLYASFFGITAIIFPFVFQHQVRSQVKKGAKKLLEEGDNPTLVGPHSLELTENGLLERTAMNTSETHLVGIQRIVEDDHHTYIYIGATQAHIIPRDRLEPDAYRAFKAELERRRN